MHPVKHNFNVTFDRPPFVASVTRPAVLKTRNGTKLGDEETLMREKGCVNPKWMQEHKLDLQTTPEEYMDLFMSLKKNKQKVKTGGKKEFLSFELLAMWTNQKAYLSGAGPNGSCYQC